MESNNYYFAVDISKPNAYGKTYQETDYSNNAFYIFESNKKLKYKYSGIIIMY